MVSGENGVDGAGSVGARLGFDDGTSATLAGDTTEGTSVTRGEPGEPGATLADDAAGGAAGSGASAPTDLRVAY